LPRQKLRWDACIAEGRFTSAQKGAQVGKAKRNNGMKSMVPVTFPLAGDAPRTARYRGRWILSSSLCLAHVMQGFEMSRSDLDKIALM
jgi:hypothetical protein